jgi:hypothetical protein
MMTSHTSTIELTVRVVVQHVGGHDAAVELATRSASSIDWVLERLLVSSPEAYLNVDSLDVRTTNINTVPNK